MNLCSECKYVNQKRTKKNWMGMVVSQKRAERLKWVVVLLIICIGVDQKPAEEGKWRLVLFRMCWCQSKTNTKIGISNNVVENDLVLGKTR